MIKLKETKPSYFKDDAHEMLKKTIYNIAQKDLIDFIISYEKGEIGQEYLEALDQKQRVK